MIVRSALIFFSSYSSVVKFPRVAHKLHEVVVVVNVGADSSVVIVPLLVGDNAIAVFVAEAGQELDEHFLVSHLAADNFGVLRAVIDYAHVARVDHAVAVLVKLAEALVDDRLAGSVGGSTDSVKELIVADDAILVEVKVVEEDAGFSLGNLGAHVLQSPIELLLVDLAVTIVVHDFEGTTHAADGSHTTGGEASFNFLENCTYSEKSRRCSPSSKIKKNFL